MGVRTGELSIRVCEFASLLILVNVVHNIKKLFKKVIMLSVFIFGAGASVDNKDLRKFVIINPDPNVDSKYRNSLSRGVVENNYVFIKSGFSQSINEISQIVRSF